MFNDAFPYSDLILLDDSVWILHASTGNSIYDFSFESNFPCRRGHGYDREQTIVARLGAINNYEQTFESLLNDKLRLVHSPEEYLRCSQFRGWYPLLQDLTPKSVCFDHIPDADEVASHLQWPIFLKGERQTSGHRRSLSFIDGPDKFREAMTHYQNDPILRWQRVVCRELVSLRPVEDSTGDRIPSSFEFRTFWWKGTLVGFGRYWWQGKPYRASDDERRAAVEIAREAASRIGVAFLVVDVAQTVDGKWIVIECNDGQESGYAGVSPVGLWQQIISLERTH